MTEPIASCTLTKEGATVDVPVEGKRKVTYEFDTSVTEVNLALRYLVLIDGKVHPSFAKKPGILPPVKDKRTDKVRGFAIYAEEGQEVSLILNSDVHPNYRSHPVYAVRVGASDIVVRITEQLKRNTHDLSTLPAPRLCESSVPGKRIQRYDGVLTGDIWMAISHLYTAEEAQSLLSTELDPAIRQAVLRIFQVMQSSVLKIELPLKDTQPKREIEVRFLEVRNVSENISFCPLLTQVLPRTHPRAYAALFSAAMAAGVTLIEVNSGWRPLLGSIVHRAGLGLDIDYLESGIQHVRLRRETLRVTSVPPEDSVSDRECILFKEYESLRKEAEKGDLEARRKVDEAYAAWVKEMDGNEPRVVHVLRDKLTQDPAIVEILDPWYLDLDTKDLKPGKPNQQRPGNESNHRHHLHITVTEPRIL